MSDTFAESDESINKEEIIRERKRRKRLANKKYYESKKQKQERKAEESQSSEFELDEHEIVTRDFEKIREQFEIFDNFHFECVAEPPIINKTTSKIIEDTSSSESHVTVEKSEETSGSTCGFSSSEGEKKKKGDLLYNTADTSLFEFLLAINTIKNKHNLSDVAVSDILRVFQVILPRGNKVPKNLNLLEKKALNDQDGKHFKICCKCNSTKLIGSLKTLNLTNDTCDSCEKKMTSFVVFDLKSQLTKILKQKHNLDQIVQCNKTSRQKDFLVSDAFGAQIYQDALEKINSNEILLSFNLNTDGAPLTNSKNYSLWPLMGSILELNTRTRESFKNLVFFGK
jgi:hypothetical protein